MITISKKQVSQTSTFELFGVKHCISRLCISPFTHVGVYVRHCSKEFSLIVSKTLMLLFPKAVNFHQLQNLNYQYKISNTTRETRRLARSQSDDCIKAYP